MDKNSYKFVKFSVASCMGVHASFCWSAVLKDKRRLGGPFNGRGCHFFTLTGLDLRNHGWSGLKATAEKTCHPTIDLKEDSDEDAVSDEDGPLDVTPKLFRGWRVSYKTSQEGRLQQRRRTLARYRQGRPEDCSKLPVAVRHRSIEQIKAAQAATQAATKVRNREYWAAQRAKPA